MLCVLSGQACKHTSYPRTHCTHPSTRMHYTHRTHCAHRTHRRNACTHTLTQASTHTSYARHARHARHARKQDAHRRARTPHTRAHIVRKHARMHRMQRTDEHIARTHFTHAHIARIARTHCIAWMHHNDRVRTRRTSAQAHASARMHTLTRACTHARMHTQQARACICARVRWLLRAEEECRGHDDPHNCEHAEQTQSMLLGKVLLRWTVELGCHPPLKMPTLTGDWRERGVRLQL